jgi:hypothetical protein
VNFGDPFGLCPDSLKNEDGDCPGGLTDDQWDRIEYAANNRMTAGARERVLGLLSEGRIHVGLSWLNRTLKPNAAAVTNVFTDNINISEVAFGYFPADFAFLLAHESQHTVQSVLMWPGNAERDADAYACSNTWGRVGYRSGSYSEYAPCGSGP